MKKTKAKGKSWERMYENWMRERWRSGKDISNDHNTFTTFKSNGDYQRRPLFNMDPWLVSTIDKLLDQAVARPLWLCSGVKTLLGT